MKSLYEESTQSLKRLPRQILKAGAVLGISIAASAILSENKQLSESAIILGAIAGIAVVAHDESKSRNL